MGTPEFAAVSLKVLIMAGHELLSVVTQPDRPKGRGLELIPAAVKKVALEHQLTILQPEAVDTPEFIKLFRELKPELVVVVAFGQKIPREILFEPSYQCINVHASLLPQYRGANPIQWSLLNGDQITGVTTMYMDEGWDTGDIIDQATLMIDLGENFSSLYQRLAELGGSLLVQTVAELETGLIRRIPQTHKLATKAPKLKPGQQLIEWSKSSQKIYNLVRALAPQPGGETFLQGERLKIIATKIPEIDLTGTNQTPGTILQISKREGILVATGDQPLLITEVQPLGKRMMSASEFANGRRLTTGMIFGS